MSVLSLKHLPRQANGYDCGLFVLCTIEFFCHANPKNVLSSAIKDLNGGERSGAKHTNVSAALKPSLLALYEPLL